MKFNFLPAKYKKIIRTGINTRLLYAGSVVFFVWTLIFGVTIFVNTLVLNIQNDALQENIRNISGLKETAEAEDFEKEISEFNMLLARVKDIKESNSFNVITIISEISDAVPAGVALQSMNFSSSTGRVFLNGNAAQRTQVITLQNRLEESDLFVEVDSPLSNLLRSENIDFQFTLTLTEDN